MMKQCGAVHINHGRDERLSERKMLVVQRRASITAEARCRREKTFETIRPASIYKFENEVRDTTFSKVSRHSLALQIWLKGCQ